MSSPKLNQAPGRLPWTQTRNIETLETNQMLTTQINLTNKNYIHIYILLFMLYISCIPTTVVPNRQLLKLPNNTVV